MPTARPLSCPLILWPVSCDVTEETNCSSDEPNPLGDAVSRRQNWQSSQDGEEFHDCRMIKQILRL
jgi:hypothetical protein